MPESLDLAIFVQTTDDRRTQLITLPLAHVRGVIMGGCTTIAITGKVTGLAR